MYTKIFIIIIILFLFILINFLLKKKEKFGVYCGRYNLNKGDAEKNCKGDDECYWFTSTDLSKNKNGWCGQNPEGAAKPKKYNLFLNDISTEENDNSSNMFSDLKNEFNNLF